MVGDSEKDIAAAQTASMPVCAVTYGMRPKVILEDLKPDFLVDSFPDLMNYPDASIEVSIKFLRTMSTGYDKPDDIPYPVLQHTFESLLHFHIDQRY